LAPVAEWIERHRTLWDERYDRLDPYLDELRRRERLDQSQQPTKEPR
jgi:hypothetical protein